MDGATRLLLIGRYKDGPRLVAEALDGLTEAQMDHRPDDGSWSAREVAHHLADSEMTSAIRLRRLLAEDAPAIDAYDEELWARRLHYRERHVAASLVAFIAARESTAEILERMTGEEWTRAGTHSEVGRYTPEVWLEIYARHAHDHAEQIRRAAGRA